MKQTISWTGLVLAVLLTLSVSARERQKNVDGFSLSLAQEWKETEYRKGWVVVAKLKNSGEPRVVPARTCGRVPWASALTLRVRTPEGVSETQVSFVDLRYVHPHGPFQIGAGQTLSSEIWLEDHLAYPPPELKAGETEVSVVLKAEGPATTEHGPSIMHTVGQLAKLWNGEVHSPWVRLSLAGSPG